MDILIEEFEESCLAAAMKDGILTGFEVDPTNETVRWGAIFRAQVKTFDKARDAAFLDLGNGLTGILYNKDVRIVHEDGRVEKGGEKSITQTLSVGVLVTVQAKTAYFKDIKNTDHFAESKLPELSMDVTLPGRYLIYAPMLERTKISQRIKDKAVRGLIRNMMRDMDERANFIIRAAASFTQTSILQREAKILKQKWQSIFRDNTDTKDIPRILYKGPDYIHRIISDNAAHSIKTIEITTMDHLDRAEKWCIDFAPDLVPKITPIELSDAGDDLALFYERDVIGQIESLYDPYVMLPGGASIIIEPTAALTAIDVNTGGDKRGHAAINKDAADAIMRHIRLRNIGGIIVIDPLNHKNVQDEKALIKYIQALALEDPCTVQIQGATKSGLIEITRKRRTLPLSKRFSLPYV